MSKASDCPRCKELEAALRFQKERGDGYSAWITAFEERMAADAKVRGAAKNRKAPNCYCDCNSGSCPCGNCRDQEDKLDAALAARDALDGEGNR